MTEIAYMIHEDWARRGKGMFANGQLVRTWNSGTNPIYVAERTDDLYESGHIDGVVGNSICAGEGIDPVFEYRELGRKIVRENFSGLSFVALNPQSCESGEVLRSLAKNGTPTRIYVHVWARNSLVHDWLVGLGAKNLLVNETVCPADPLRIEACMMMVNEEYNGLRHGRGKDVVLTLLHAFAKEGDQLDAAEWAPTFFAAGGSFKGAETVKKFVEEVRAGKRHRYAKDYLRPNIVNILRERITSGD